MKNQLPLFKSIIIILLLIFIESCGNSESPSAESVRINALAASWNVNSITNDNQNVSALYSGFSLSIDGLNFSTTHGGNAWPSSGSFSFENNNLDELLRSDGTVISIDEISSTKLILSFNTPELNGRNTGITGGFIFTLSKQ